jgi:hypothetical protein
MRKSVYGILLLIIILLIVSGCSVTHRLNTKPIQALEKDLKEVSETIDSVKVTFTRPEVRFRINMSEEPTDEIVDTLVTKVKTFSTEANMDLIAKEVNWPDHIWDVNLVINTDDDDQTVEQEYTASYFKTSNDQSNDNIDEYQTWYKSK